MEQTFKTTLQRGQDPEAVAYYLSSALAICREISSSTRRATFLFSMLSMTTAFPRVSGLVTLRGSIILLNV